MGTTITDNALQIGQILQLNYRIITPLKSGVFGQTYIAEDIEKTQNNVVLIKRYDANREQEQLFRSSHRLYTNEISNLKTLGDHPSIPKFLDAFEDKTGLYVVQEFIDGTLLSDLIPLKIGKEDLWSEDEVIHLLLELTRVLEFVHSHCFIHSDLKPDNIIRRKSDQNFTIIDFANAQMMTDEIEADAQLIKINNDLKNKITVTPAGYIAAEQLVGIPHYVSDLYSIGIMGIQALTGIDPTEISIGPKHHFLNWPELLKKHHLKNEFDEDLLDILKTMVSYYPEDRIPSAQALIDSLKVVERKKANKVMVFYEWPGYGPVATTTVNDQEWSFSKLQSERGDKLTDTEMDYPSAVPKYQPLDFDPLEEIPMEELSSLQQGQNQESTLLDMNDRDTLEQELSNSEVSRTKQPPMVDFNPSDKDTLEESIDSDKEEENLVIADALGASTDSNLTHPSSLALMQDIGEEGDLGLHYPEDEETILDLNLHDFDGGLESSFEIDGAEEDPVTQSVENFELFDEQGGHSGENKTYPKFNRLAVGIGLATLLAVAAIIYLALNPIMEFFGLGQAQQLAIQAEEAYQAGSLEEAIAIAESIPEDSAIYEESQAQLAQWRQEWANANASVTTIEEAHQSQDWLTILRTAAQVPGTPSLQERIAPLVQQAQIQVDNEAFANLKTAFSLAETRNFNDAIDYLEQIPPESTLAARVQPKLEEYHQKKEVRARYNFHQAVNYAQKREFKQAINYLSQIPPNTPVSDIAQAKLAEYKEYQRIRDIMIRKGMTVAVNELPGSLNLNPGGLLQEIGV